MNFAGGIPSTYYSKYVVEGLGGTAVIIGVIGFVSNMILAFVQFPGGVLADTQGRRWIIVVMTYGVAFTYILYAVAPTWHFIVVAAAIQNLCLVYQPALMAMRSDSIHFEKRGMGFATITFLSNIALMFSPIIAGFLYLQYGLVPGMRIAYFIVTVFFLAAATLRIKLKETLEVKEEGRNIRKVVRAYPQTVKESLASWKILPRSMFYLFLANAIFTFAWAMSLSYQVLYATDPNILNLGGAEWAFLATLQAVATILFALPGGKLVDKIGRKKPLMVAWLIVSPAMVLFIYGDFLRLVVTFLLIGIYSAFYNSAYFAFEADLVPRKQRGKMVGFTRFIIYILTAVGQVTGGFLYQYISPLLPFIFTLVSAVICVLIMLFFVHETKEREN